MGEKLSKSQMLRQWINDKLDNHYDYSSSQSRTTDFNEFVNSHQDDNFDEKNHKPLYHYILKKEINKRGIKPESYGLGLSKPQVFRRKTGSIDATITPKPKAIELIPEPEPVEESEQTVLQPDNTHVTEFGKEHTENEVRHLIQGAYVGLKFKYPYIKPLDQEEISMLAGSLVPFCNRHLQGDVLVYITPIVMITTIIAPKIKKAREELREIELQTKDE